MYARSTVSGNWYCEVVQRDKGYGFIEPESGGKDVFVYFSAVERAGLHSLNEDDKVSYEVVSNRGKESADNLRVVGH